MQTPEIPFGKRVEKRAEALKGKTAELFRNIGQRTKKL
jgi:hypothetical protein